MGKFEGIFQQSAETDVAGDEVVHGSGHRNRAVAQTTQIPRTGTRKREGQSSRHAKPSSTVSDLPPQPGRLGKSTNPDFRQVTTYLRRSTHDAARRLIVGTEEDLSDVLEHLLANWVRRHEAK